VGEQVSGLKAALAALAPLGDFQANPVLAEITAPLAAKLAQGEARLVELRSAKQASLPADKLYRRAVAARDQQLRKIAKTNDRLSEADEAISALQAKREELAALLVSQQTKLVRLLLKAETAAATVASAALGSHLEDPPQESDDDLDDGASDSTGHASMPTPHTAAARHCRLARRPARLRSPAAHGRAYAPGRCSRRCRGQCSG
jgi:hypothetical protein